VISMIIAVKKEGTLTWTYYEMSQQQFDTFRNRYVRGEPLDFSELKDITAEMLSKGFPAEAEPNQIKGCEKFPKDVLKKSFVMQGIVLK